jgi:hypothetical protein
MVNLVDDGRISGSQTSTLAITSVHAADAGLYDVVVSSGDCGSVTSSAATLAVVPCPADFNGDSAINSNDFFDFTNAFFAGLPSADINQSGTVDSQDFFDFLTLFFAGC